MTQRRAIYVISDSTGETGAKVVQAALLQFRHEQVSLRIFSNLRDKKALFSTLDRAAAENALVVYTLVRAEQRRLVTDRAAQYAVKAVDLMGPLMARIGNWLGESPVSTPGLLHKIDIATGTLLQTINTGSAGQLFGVAIFGEETAGGPGPSVPEPGVLLLMSLGLFGLAFSGRRRRRG